MQLTCGKGKYPCLNLRRSQLLRRCPLQKRRIRSIRYDEQIAYLAMAVNDVKMFNVSLLADELKAIFACKPEAIVRSNNNRLVAFFFSGLSSRGLITPNWQSVIANHKLFLSKDTSRDKYINQSDLSTATNYIRDVGVEGKYATLEKYLMQVKRL